MNKYLRQPLAFVHLTTVMHDAGDFDWSPKQIRHLYNYTKVMQTHFPNLYSFRRIRTVEESMAPFKQSTFSSLKLTKDDEKAFEKWIKDNNIDALKCLNEIGGAGFKFSASWVIDQNAWCFSVIGTDATKKHRNMVMTSWSDDLGEAIAIAAYKHFVVCNGEEWPTKDDSDRWG